jgi:hypothetical protein
MKCHDCPVTLLCYTGRLRALHFCPECRKITFRVAYRKDPRYTMTCERRTRDMFDLRYYSRRRTTSENNNYYTISSIGTTSEHHRHCDPVFPDARLTLYTCDPCSGTNLDRVATIIDLDEKAHEVR